MRVSCEYQLDIARLEAELATRRTLLQNATKQREELSGVVARQKEQLVGAQSAIQAWKDRHSEATAQLEAMRVHAEESYSELQSQCVIDLRAVCLLYTSPSPRDRG